jgi:hypothetical protein
MRTELGTSPSSVSDFDISSGENIFLKRGPLKCKRQNLSKRNPIPTWGRGPRSGRH